MREERDKVKMRQVIEKKNQEQQEKKVEVSDVESV